MSSLTESIDRYLDQLEERLPPLPAIALRVQRRISKRAMSMMCEMASTFQSSARTAADETATSASTIAGTARSAGDDVLDAAAVAGRRVVGQTKAETRQAVDAVETEAERTAESGREAIDELHEDAIEALEAVEQAIDPDKSSTGEAYEDLTKQQLYDRATAMNIAGRSSMNKAQLIEAVRSESR